MGRKLNRLINELRDMGLQVPGLGQRAPRLNIRDDDKKIVIFAEVPGYDEKDIHIETDEDSVRIIGERPEGAIGDGVWILKESRLGSFSRTVELPYPVEIERASAKCRNGMLVIELPKKAETRRKTIKVE